MKTLNTDASTSTLQFTSTTDSNLVMYWVDEKSGKSYEQLLETYQGEVTIDLLKKKFIPADGSINNDDQIFLDLLTGKPVEFTTPDGVIYFILEIDATEQVTLH